MKASMSRTGSNISSASSSSTGTSAGAHEPANLRKCNSTGKLARHQAHHNHHHHQQQQQQQQQQQHQQHRQGSGRNVRKRVMANERERERTKSLNQALETLRNRIPVPDAEKRSKIQTLKMAKVYIEFLHELNAWKQTEQQVDQDSSTSNPEQTATVGAASNPTQITFSSQHQLRTANASGAQAKQTTTDPHNHHQQLESGDPSTSPLSYKFYVFRQNT